MIVLGFFDAGVATDLGYLFGAWALGWIVGFGFKAFRKFVEKAT